MKTAGGRLRVEHPGVSGIYPTMSVLPRSIQKGTIRCIPAWFIRGGTSKGVFLRESDLPSRDQWEPIFRGIMGSPDRYGRQLNGMGGGLSSLSKLVVVGPSSRSGVDVEYTFIQMGIKDGQLDLSGNCGNLSAAVAPYAIASGIFSTEGIPVESKSLTMQIWNSNTDKLISTTFPIRSRQPHLDSEECTTTVDGVEGPSSKITMDYLHPGGARTGKLFPSGNKRDMLRFHSGSTGIWATLFDCTNPTVYVQAKDLNMDAALLPVDFSAELLEKLEQIRRAGASQMGLDPDVQAQPKICVVAAPQRYRSITGEFIEADTIDVVVRAISMQQPHQAMPMTVAMATAAAALSSGTVVNQVSRPSNDGQICLGHPSGRLLVGADLSEGGDVKAVKVFRTARFLMRGDVFW